MRRILGIALVAVLALSLSACSDDEEAANPCESAQELAASVRALGDIDLVQEGKAGVDEAVDEVTANWEAFDEASQDRFQAELDALEAALGQVEEAIDGVSGDDLGGSVTQIGEAITAVDEAWNELATAIESGFTNCDLSGETTQTTDTTSG